MFGVFEIERAIMAKYCDDNAVSGDLQTGGTQPTHNANLQYLSDLTDAIYNDIPFAANKHFTQTNLLSTKKRAQTDSKPIANVNVDRLKAKLNAEIKQLKQLSHSCEQLGCERNDAFGCDELIGAQHVSDRCSDELLRMAPHLKHIVDTNARNCEKHCALQHSIKGKVIDIDDQQLDGVIHRAKQMQQIEQTINVFKTYF